MADVADGFNRKLDLITEREVVYDFVSRLSIGKDWTCPDDDILIFDADTNFKNILRQIAKSLPQSVYENLKTLSIASVTVSSGTSTVSCTVDQQSNTKASLLLAMSERTQLDLTDCFSISSTSSTTKNGVSVSRVTYSMTTDVPYENDDVIKFYTICAAIE